MKEWDQLGENKKKSSILLPNYIDQFADNMGGYDDTSSKSSYYGKSPKLFKCGGISLCVFVVQQFKLHTIERTANKIRPRDQNKQTSCSFYLVITLFRWIITTI